MAAVAAPLMGAPPCPFCAGGGEVNGIPCRHCAGRGRLAVKRAGVAWRAIWRRGSLAAAGAAGTVVRWSATIPGLAGAAGVTMGLALTVHSVFPRVPAVAVALLVGGCFGLAVDRRL